MAIKEVAGCCGNVCVGFRDFILRGNVVDLAVAVVIGGAFKQLIDAFVASFITPLFGMIGTGDSTQGLQFTVLGSTFPYGLFVTALISFLILCVLVYFVIVLPLMGLVERFFPKRTCPECFMEDLHAESTRCKYCCSSLPPLKPAVTADEVISAAPSATAPKV